MSWLFFLGALLAGLAAFALLAFGFAGQFLLALAFLAFHFLNPEDISWGLVGFAFALAIAAEIIEFCLGMLLARQAGASRLGTVCGAVGGLIGAIAGSGLFPVVGSIFGLLLGTFTGVYVIEAYAQKKSSNPSKAAMAAVLGRASGLGLKIAISLWMTFDLCFRLWPL